MTHTPENDVPCARCGRTWRGEHAQWCEDRAPTENDACPEARNGVPCQKGRDHGGGHWFMSDDQYACLRAEHYDPVSVLTLGPLVHLDVPCTRAIPPEKEN